MTSASTQPAPRPSETEVPIPRQRVLWQSVLMIAGLIGLAVVAIVFRRDFWPTNGNQDTGPPPGQAVPTAGGTSGADQQVTLSEGKVRTTGLRLATVTSRLLQQTSVVPGRVALNPARRIELRAPAEGSVLSISVKPGDHVKPGDVLAVLQIPEIGTLRAKVLQSQAELTLALQTARWEKATYDNLESLMAALQKRPKPQDVQQRFERRILGKYRERVISAYSRFLLADRLTADVKPLAAKGIVPGRTMQERTGARDVAEAAYRSIREQSVFDARQARDRSQFGADNARRELAISRHHLSVDLGYDEEPSAGDFGRTLAIVELRAPISGTIEEWNIALTERFEESKLLFVVADTSTLTIRADIREQEWPAVSLQPGTELSVEIPALPDLQPTAKLWFVGRKVDTGTRSIPLFASIDNAKGLLRPGLFVRIRVPLEQSRTVPAVPTSAVLHQGSTTFVFQSTGPRTYRRVTVQIGVEDHHWTEIIDGVKPGDRVVDRAAFVLKSELLLEGE